MPHSTEQKVKLLVLWDILQKNTDEEHPLTTNAIIAALKERGIAVSRKTLYEVKCTPKVRQTFGGAFLCQGVKLSTQSTRQSSKYLLYWICANMD